MSDPNPCVFCALVARHQSSELLSTQDDIVFQDGFVTAFVSSHQWPPHLPNVLVIPNQHYVDVFDLPIDLSPHIQRAVRTVSQALISVFGADGVTLRQSNREAGDQDVFHHHTHVLPRYRDGGDYPRLQERILWDPSERAELARRLSDSIPRVHGSKEFHRTLPRKRMAAGVLYYDEAGRVLLVKPTYKETWEIPGGAVESDESPWQACQREVKEELGLDLLSGTLLTVDYHPSTDTYLESLMFVFDAGVMSASDHDLIRLQGSELSEARFVTRTEALALVGSRIRARLDTVWSVRDPIQSAYLEQHRTIS